MLTFADESGEDSDEQMQTDLSFLKKAGYDEVVTE